MIIILSIILVGNVSASGFSPSSLIFNLNPGEKQCQTITMTSDSKALTVSDIWAANKNIDWKVSLFSDSANAHGLSLDYPAQLMTERTLNVCLSGSEIGEYHGVILIKEAQEGNSIIQMGVWIKVVISEKPAPSPSQTSAQTQQTTQQSQATNTPDTQAAANNNQTTSTTNPESSQNAGITGAVIGSSTGKSIWLAIIILAILTAATIVVYKIRRRTRWKNYGY